jgi:hypothetical protein
MPICRYCRRQFDAIGMTGQEAEHDWTDCCGEVADKYHALKTRVQPVLLAASKNIDDVIQYKLMAEINALLSEVE